MTKEELKKEIELKKEYLKSYQDYYRRSKILQVEIDELRHSKMFPSVIIDGMPRGNSVNDLSSYAAKLDDLIHGLEELKVKKIEKYKEITEKIESMESEMDKNLLTLRYLRDSRWEDICISLNYEWAQIHRLHTKALKNFKMHDID